MRLDHIRIAIRERAPSDLFDLTLQVVRVHAKSLLMAALIGIPPVAIANLALVGPSLDTEEGFAWHGLLSLALAWVATPLATAPITVYLAQAMFTDRPSWTKVFQDLRATLGPMLLVQLLFRAILPIWLLAAWYQLTEDSDSPAIWLVLFLATFMGIFVAARPFLNEVLLLERNPLRAKDRMTTGKRNRAIHEGLQGEMFSQSLLNALAAVAMTYAVWFAIKYVRALWANDWDASIWFEVAAWQVAVWSVVAYFAVVRFLWYLNTRIRREGWEVDLALRAAAERIEHDSAKGQVG
jgi:hypothetical protein